MRFGLCSHTPSIAVTAVALGALTGSVGCGSDSNPSNVATGGHASTSGGTTSTAGQTATGGSTAPAGGGGASGASVNGGGPNAGGPSAGGPSAGGPATGGSGGGSAGAGVGGSSKGGAGGSAGSSMAGSGGAIAGSGGTGTGGGAGQPGCAQGGALGSSGTGGYVRTAFTGVSVPVAAAVGQRTPPSNESLDPKNAFDGDKGTRWGTGVYQVGNETFTVDMHQCVTFKSITMYPGTQDDQDFPGKSDVYVSNDGVNFGTPVVTGHVGKGGTDTITLPSAQTARYIKIVNTQIKDKTHWWAIGELNVFP